MQSTAISISRFEFDENFLLHVKVNDAMFELDFFRCFIAGFDGELSEDVEDQKFCFHQGKSRSNANSRS
jgi:hypothetical protein